MIFRAYRLETLPPITRADLRLRLVDLRDYEYLPREYVAIIANLLVNNSHPPTHHRHTRECSLND